MSGQEQTPTPTFRAFALTLLVFFLMAGALLPAWTQSAVPPTARQAATMPQYAPRLAHHAQSPKAGDSLSATQHMLRQMAQDNWMYENGPVNGNTDAWTINFGFVVSDTFTVTQSDTTLDGLLFAVWLFPGDTLTSAEVSLTSEEFGGTTYFDQTVPFTQSNCIVNEFGYYVCTESGSFNGPVLQPGTYWVNLQNANVPSGNPAYWDENSGIGCHSQGCPSLASENELGTLPSEAFSILGTTTITVPPPQCFAENGNPQVIHDFTGQEAGESIGDGVTIDRSGNLYGITQYGGDNAAGLAYKEFSHGDGWLFDPLYSFTGGYYGNSPTGMMVGPNGSLYGGAYGGIQNCGSDGSVSCGLVFNLKPQPTACFNAMCSWIERVPYRFAGGADPSGTINVSAYDQQGNLYGTSSSGGVGACSGGCGTVFKLTPGLGGWTETVLYSFTGGDDGSAPSQVLLGNDGNLYGIAGGGVYGRGLVFQLTPAGDHWNESVVHSFQPGVDGEDPSYLVQDGAGNLYGIAFWLYKGAVFMLQRSGDGWTFSEFDIQHPYGNIEILNNLTIDSAGTLYGSGGGGTGCRSGRCSGSPDDYPYIYAYIFKMWLEDGGLQYQEIGFFNYELFPASGALAVDAEGYLYGTTWYCGAYNAGTIWRFLP